MYLFLQQVCPVAEDACEMPVVGAKRFLQNLASSHVQGFRFFELTLSQIPQCKDIKATQHDLFDASQRENEHGSFKQSQLEPREQHQVVYSWPERPIRKECSGACNVHVPTSLRHYRCHTCASKTFALLLSFEASDGWAGP